MTTSIPVWDWPLRLFHWLLALAVTGAYLTGSLGGSLTDWHNHFGKLTVCLLVFRLIWGFAGNSHARFANFLPTPANISRYLNGEWREHGHNPLGAMAVFTILMLLTTLALTGLFANDDIGFEGPLYALVDKAFSDTWSGWPDSLVTPLLILLGLHLSAIGFYHFAKGIDLIKPMLTGNKQVNHQPPPQVSVQGADGLTILGSLVLPVLLTALIWHGTG